MKELSGLEGRLQLKLIADYNEKRKDNGKRPVKAVDGKLHPAVREVITKTSKKEMAARVLRHLISVIKGYHAKGRILMSAHSHFVALCYAVRELNAETTLKFTTKAFINRLYLALRETIPCKYRSYRPGSYPSFVNENDLLRDVASTIILGRFLTHPRGFEKGWSELFTIKDSGTMTNALYPHGCYYCKIMKRDDAAISRLPQRTEYPPSALMMFRNFHFKPNGSFCSLMHPSGGYESVHHHAIFYNHLIWNVMTFADPTADELTLFLAKVDTNCSRLSFIDPSRDPAVTALPPKVGTFSGLFSAVMEAHPSVVFSLDHLKRIGRWLTMALARDTARYAAYIVDLARLVGVLRKTKLEYAISYLDPDAFADESRASRFTDVLSTDEFFEIADFAKIHRPATFRRLQGLTISAMDTVLFNDMPRDYIERLKSLFPDVRLRINTALYERYPVIRCTPADADALMCVATDFLGVIQNDMYAQTWEAGRILRVLMRSYDGPSWSRLRLRRVFAYPPDLDTMREFISDLVRSVIVPTMNRLKRKREVTLNSTVSDEESRYGKRPRSR